MEPQATLTISWQALTVVMGVLVVVVGMATGYLKLFMQTKLAELEKSLIKEFKLEFQSKESQNEKNLLYEARLTKLEGKVFAS